MLEETTVQLTPIQVRQAEVAAYDTNITNYTSILATLNGDWDDDLLHLKNVEPQEAARQCNMERLPRLAELQFHSQISNLLKTEMVERFKANAILNAMILNA